MTEADKRIAALERQVAEMKAEIKASQPTVIDHEAAAKQHLDQMHQASERRMANAYIPSRAERDAFNAATPPDVCRGLAQDGRAPLTPKGMLPTSNVHSGGRAPINTTGWQNETPIGPSPHQRYVDAQLDAQDRRDRYEADQREAAIKQAELRKAGK